MATKLVPDLNKKSYKDRLNALKLTSLVIMPKRGDLIDIFKILNGLDRKKWKNKFEKIIQGN